MNNLPLVLVACFSLGIVFAHFFKISFWPVYIFGLIAVFISIKLGGGSLKIRTVPIIFLFLSVFILGVLHFKNSGIISKSSVSRHIGYQDETVYTLKGFVNNNPVIKDSRVLFIFKVEELQFNKHRYKSCGDILVYAKSEKGIIYGEELILLGNLRRPYRLYNPNILGVMHLKHSLDLVRLNKNKGNLVKRLAFYLKNRVEEIFFKRLSPLAAGVVDAMVLGEKKYISPVVYDAMIKSGTVHILVVSGFNVGIIAFIFGLLFKILRIPRKPRYILVIVFLVLYCFITGASTPVVRATVMGIFLILGQFIKRESDVTNSLALALIFILVLDPRALFSISFQLSFISVAAIVYLYPRIKSFLKLEKIKIRPLKFILDGFLVSFSAWLGTMGLIVYYFKVFSPVTLLANVFIVPLATLITLTGLAMVMVSLIFPSLSGPLAATNEILVIILLKVNAFFISLPFAYLKCV